MPGTPPSIAHAPALIFVAGAHAEGAGATGPEVIGLFQAGRGRDGAESFGSGVIARDRSVGEGRRWRAASRVPYHSVRLSDPRMPSGGFDDCPLVRRPAGILAWLPECQRFLQGDLSWLDFKAKVIPYERRRRPVGELQWTLWKKLRYSFDGPLRTSCPAIRLMSLVGTLTALWGVFYSPSAVYVRLTRRRPYIGRAPIMIAIQMPGGAIMRMLGVIGESVWRIYDETRGRPMDIVRERHARVPADPAVSLGTGRPALD